MTPLRVTVVRDDSRAGVRFVTAVITMLVRAWIVMLVLPVATAGAFTPGFGRSLAIAVLLSWVGTSGEYALWTVPSKRGAR